MNKFISILLTVVLATSAFAQEQSAAKSSVKKGEFAKLLDGLDGNTRIQILKKYDKDGDGRLDKNERVEAMKALKEKSVALDEIRSKHSQEIIKKFDADGDGKLDKKELIGFLEEQRKVMEKARKNMMRRRGNFNPPKEILTKYDKDGDGKLSAEERKIMFNDARERRAAIIKKYDANGDGNLSDEERLKLTQDPQVQQMMKRMWSTNPPPPPPPALN